MKLDDYLRSKRVTNDDFAVVLGYDRSTVSRLRRRLLEPSAEMARRIYRATDGLVTPNDLILPPLEVDLNDAPGHAPSPLPLPPDKVPEGYNRMR